VVDGTSVEDSRSGAIASAEQDSQHVTEAASLIFDNPSMLLNHFLARYFDIVEPYTRPTALDHIEEIEQYLYPIDAKGSGSPAPHHASNGDASSSPSGRIVSLANLAAEKSQGSVIARASQRRVP
jgi:hypothetical protein